MEAYRSKYETIIDLHERGFTEDLVLMGDNLFWIQQGKLLRDNDFIVIEYHWVQDPPAEYAVVFGIVSFRFAVKAILMCYSQSLTDKNAHT